MKTDNSHHQNCLNWTTQQHVYFGIFTRIYCACYFCQMDTGLKTKYYFKGQKCFVCLFNSMFSLLIVFKIHNKTENAKFINEM